jgi:hypothetical protein
MTLAQDLEFIAPIIGILGLALVAIIAGGRAVEKLWRRE